MRPVFTTTGKSPKIGVFDFHTYHSWMDCHRFLGNYMEIHTDPDFLFPACRCMDSHFLWLTSCHSELSLGLIDSGAQRKFHPNGCTHEHIHQLEPQRRMSQRQEALKG